MGTVAETASTLGAIVSGPLTVTSRVSRYAVVTVPSTALCVWVRFSIFRLTAVADEEAVAAATGGQRGGDVGDWGWIILKSF